MLEIVPDRYGRGATRITSRIPVDRWQDLIGEPTLAAAILDRIIHNAVRLQLNRSRLTAVTGYGETDQRALRHSPPDIIGIRRTRKVCV